MAQSPVNNGVNVDTPPQPDVAASTSQDDNRPKSEWKSTFGLHRYYSRVCLNPDKCLIPSDMLAKSPSRDDGVDEILERDLRALGCELIQSASILLKLPQVAAATAQILYQRYFYAKSFVKNDYEHVAMACVCLASKIEEEPRRPRDVINVFHHLKQLSKCRSQSNRKPRIRILDQEYSNLKNLMIKAERRVLNVLGFCVHVKHPHKMITAYVKALELTENYDFIQKAWSYINDGLRTDIFLRYHSETIACACIFLAARVMQVPLPMSPQPWWELFDAEKGDVWEIALILLRMYNRTKPISWSRIDRRINQLRMAYQEAQSIKVRAAEEEARKIAEAKKAAIMNRVKDKGKSNDKENRRRNKERDRSRRRRRSRSTTRSSSSSDSSRSRSRRRNEKRRRDRSRDRSDRQRPSGSTIDLKKSYTNGTDRRRADSPRRNKDIGVKLKKKEEKSREEKKRKRSTSRDRTTRGGGATSSDKHKRANSRDKEREVIAALGKRSPAPPSSKIRRPIIAPPDEASETKRNRK